jgi:Ca2+-binding RTX toxin-like protein
MTVTVFGQSAVAPITTASFPYDDSKVNRSWYYDVSTLSELKIDVESVWVDYTGSGVTIAVIDSQIDFDNLELADSYDSTRDYSFVQDTDEVVLPETGLTNEHGTMVAGVIGAGNDNGSGSAGIAHDASVVGLAIDYASSDILDDVHAALLKAAESDIVNNSWSFTQSFADDFNEMLHFAAALEYTASTGRDGLGTVIVFSAGNAGSEGPSNYHNFQNSPYTIAVGAVAPSGETSDFSSMGANVLLSGPGQNVYTTTLNGYGGASGTSFSAPIVSATVGLMLEANDALGYRDVQQILAISAQRDGLSDTPSHGDGWLVNGAGTVNGGGMHYSDVAGYGFVNAHDAVRLAETWSLQQTADTRATVTETVQSDAVMLAGETDHISVQIDVDADMLVEHVQLSMDFGWRNTADLDVYLTSAAGTTVRLVYDTPASGTDGSLQNFWFTSVASMSEEAAGTWTLDIYNRDPDATQRKDIPMKSALHSVSLQVHGRDTGLADDTYFYTDDFAFAVADDAADRLTLKDIDGGIDTLNAAAVTTATSVDLAAGQAVIAGQTVDMTDSGIENVLAGDGDDSLRGDAGDNHLFGGRGDDRIDFGLGADTLDGGAGTDTLYIDTPLTWLQAFIDDAGDFFLGLVNGPVSLLSGFEFYSFSDVVYSFSTLLDAVSGAGDDTTGGGAGDDTAGDDTTGGGAGDDTAGGGAGDDTTGGGAGDGVETLIGQDTAEKIFADVQDERISALGGDDTVFAAAGNDTLLGGDGADLLQGETGDDVLFGGAGVDTLVGGDGADLYVLDANDLGNVDLLRGFNGAEGDRIVLVNVADPAAISFDLLDGGRTSTLTVTMDGVTHQVATMVKPDIDITHVDSLTAADAAALLNGGTGDDTTGGGTGDDTTGGGAGDDTTGGGTGDDTTGGGAGDDTPTYVFDTLTGTATGEKLYGTASRDLVYALDGDDTVWGEAGQDTLYGDAGNDFLDGGAGDDVLIGGSGMDTLMGGDGADTFVFDLNDVDAVDTLRGFDTNEGDRIVVANVDNPDDVVIDIVENGRTSDFTVTYDGETHVLATLIKPEISDDDIDILSSAATDSLF